MKKRNYYLLIGFLFCLHFGSTNVSAQTNIFDLMERTDLNIHQVEQWADDYFNKVGTGKGTGYKQYQRWLYERKFHIDEGGRFISSDIEDRAYYSSRIRKSYKTSLTWSEMGPQSWSYTSGWNPGVGRITSVAVHPADTTKIYVSSPGGGIWKSTNSGQTWTPLIDFVNSSWMNVYHLQIDPLNQDVIYASLTQGGVIKSTNAGITWSATGAGPSDARQVKVHPNNSNIVFCAALNGLWRSVNAGSSWTQVESANKEDIEFNPSNSDLMYASGSSGSSCVWKSTDNGMNWTAISSADGITHAGRTLMAVSPANPAIVYAVQANGSIFGRMYISRDSGSTYVTTVVGNPDSSTNYFGYETDGTGTTGQATYDMAIGVNPSNADEVHIAGIICWKSSNGGSSFSATTAWSYPNSTGYIHADVHALEWVNNTLYAGTDGGVFKSSNQAEDWIDLSAGLGIRQAYRISCSQSDPNVLTTGSQDNGTSFRRNNGSWVDWIGADGMDNDISPTDAAIAIGTSQNGAIYKTTNSGASRSNLAQASPGNWVTPLVMNPVSHDTIYIGWTGVWRSVNGGASWTNLSPGITVKLDALAISSANTSFIYASQGATLYRTQNGGSTWTSVSAPSFISSIFVSKNDPSKIWITCNSASNRVFVSTNAGTSFTDLSSGLPALSARSVAVDEDSLETIYVGMNIGVYYRDNAQNTWYEHAAGLPLVAVNEVEIQKSGNKLRVATYGRGVWESDLQNIVIPCNAPNGLSTTSITNESAVINWNAVPGAVSYKIDYRKAADTAWTELNAATSQNWEVLTGLAEGSAYFWRIRTNCTAKNSPFAITSLTTATSCNAPSGLTTSSITLNSAVISWDVASGAINYNVKYKKSTDTLWTQFQTGVNQNWNVLNGLTDGTLYYWEVSTNCTSISSNYSSTYFITADSCLAPTGLQTDSITPTSALFGWDTVAGAINYRVEYKKNSDQFWTVLAMATSQNRISVSGLSASTSYMWRVLTNCQNQNSSFAMASFLTDSPCYEPQNLSINGSTSLNISASWSPVSGAIAYSLEYKLHNDSAYTVISNISATSYSLTNLSQGIYDFRVRSHCHNSFSGYSSVISYKVYCHSAGLNTSNGHIDNIQLGAIRRSSGNDQGYYDGTALSANLNIGNQYTLVVSTGNTGKSSSYFSVYIDYNADGDFSDTGELVANFTSKTQRNSNAVFSVPSFAQIGLTRMRIIMSNNQYENSCGIYSSGETEDYSINISSPPEFAKQQEEGIQFTEPKLYPVPAQEVLYLKYDLAEDAQWMEFKLIDLNGRAILGSRIAGTKGENILPIDLSTIGNGVYIVQVLLNGNLTNHKINIVQ